MIAKALSNECECHFIYISGSEFINKYVGQGAKKVREIFN